MELGQADIQWLSMDTPIENPIEKIEDDSPKDKQNVRLIGDVSQKYLLRGLIAESEEDLLTARKYGLQCLQSDSGFHSLMQNAGGRISGLTMRSLQPSEQMIACSVRTVVAWSKWLHLQHVNGASLDISSIAEMVSWVRNNTKQESSKSLRSKWIAYAIGLGYSLLEKPTTTQQKHKTDSFQKAIQDTKHPYWHLDYIEYVLLKEENWKTAKETIAVVNSMSLSQSSQDRMKRLKEVIGNR